MRHKQYFVFLSLLVVLTIARANETTMQEITSNKASVLRGAKLFMNYCSGCHSLKYFRYNRLAEDLDLRTSDGKINKNLVSNLVYTQANLNDPILAAMPLTDAKQWFGVAPPDLSLSAKEHGPTWLYSYLKSFYLDNSRPFGVNNLFVPNVAMPNVLEPLIGEKVVHSSAKTHISSLLVSKQGELSEIEVDRALQDLVTFLVYIADPSQLTRHHLGSLVLLFLCLWFIAAYCLNRLYWRRLK